MPRLVDCHFAFTKTDRLSANSQDFGTYFSRKLEEIEFRSYDAAFTGPKVVGRNCFGTLNFP